MIFDERPFVSYDVRPTKVASGKRYAVYNSETGAETYSGTFTVTFSAYAPYGRLHYKDYTDFDAEGAGQYCGMVEHDEMPASPTVSSRDFLLYNCGTQPCDTLFLMGGTASSGLTITNNTNGTSCTLTSFPSTGYLEIDSRYGSIAWVHGNDRDLAFNYHVKGFVTLDPYMACEDEIVAGYTGGSTTVVRQNADFDERFVGKYIYIDGGWRKITAVSAGGTATVNSAPTHTGVEQTKAVTMNEISITGENLTLTRLEADYFPVIV